jgi:UDP-N-acetylglucosamine--N-acetylmuramyl-(pentapeptide) pyrophosphoryl-undecaprenol N-acetylglucosamine transferase
MTPTLLIMAGGTGGHVFPGLAVADVVKARGWRVVWMGAKSGMEARIVPARGYEMRWVRVSGVRGKGWLTKLLLPFNLLVAFWQSARAIFRLRPDVVLGMGGYVAFPGGMMASLLARPLAIHEQNAIAGLTNRLLARLADRVLLAFPDALAGGEWCGNPVREDIAGLAPPEQRYAGRDGPLRLLVIGGSLGAQALNTVVPQALARLVPSERPIVVHQSGEKHLDQLRASYAAAGVDGTLVSFIDDMGARYAECDLVLCRAGATTIAELAAAGIASVLVPYPHAVDDHQSANARYLVEHDAALLAPQASLDAASLATMLGSLDRPRLQAMAQRARALGRPDAAIRVADRCLSLASAMRPDSQRGAA